MLKEIHGKKIISSDSPIEYFKKLVENATTNQKLELSDMSEYYIVNLLVEHLKSKNVFINSENGTNEEPISSILSKAMEAHYSEEKIKIFKKIGDFTLFISGFFSDSINRKLFDVDYYHSIGGIAYSNVSTLMRKKVNGKAFSELYKDLSERFQSICDILAEVSEKSLVNSNTDILRIYERWGKTSSKRDESLLKEKGIIPVYVDNQYLN